MSVVMNKINSLLKQKNKGVLSAEKAMRGVYEELRKQTISELQGVEAVSYSAYYLKQNRAMLEKAIADAESRAKRDMNGNLDKMWDGGGDLVKDTMRAGELTVSGQAYFLNPTLLDTLKDFASTRLESLSEAAWSKINGELTMGVLGQKTPWEVSKAIAGTIKDPGIYKNVMTRAATITEVEMGRVFSTATAQSLEKAAQAVPGMMKEWNHAGHPFKPRMSHLALHGQRKNVDEPFVTGSLVIDYPRDPKASIEEVIHCGCEVIPWHPSWE
jgi:hypothetical protein